MAVSPNLLFPTYYYLRLHKHDAIVDDELRKCIVTMHMKKTKTTILALSLYTADLMSDLSLYFAELLCHCKNNSKFSLYAFLNKTNFTLRKKKWGNSVTYNHKAIKAESNCDASFIVLISENSWQPSSFTRIQK